MAISTILLDAGIPESEINALDEGLVRIIEKYYQPIEIRQIPRSLLVQGANALLEALKKDEKLKGMHDDDAFSEEEKQLLTKINYYLNSINLHQQVWALDHIKVTGASKFGPASLGIINKLFTEKKMLLQTESDMLLEYEQSLKNKIPLQELFKIEKFQSIYKKIEQIQSALKYHQVQTESDFMKTIKPIINQEINRQKELLIIKTIYMLAEDDYHKRLYSKIYQNWSSTNLNQAKNDFIDTLTEHLGPLF